MPPETSFSADVELLGEDPIVDEVIDEPEVEEVIPPESDDEPKQELQENDEDEDKVKEPEKKRDYLPHERPTLTDIRKEFPDFFKKFPQMEHMLFREKEYTELFPTVSEAKDAAEASEALQDFRDDLFTGNGEKFVSALKDQGELTKFGKNFITNLQKTDQQAYWNAITPTFENVVRAFYREGQRRNDASLVASAENLSIYLFDTDEVAQGKKTFVKDEVKTDPQVARERTEWEREKSNTFTISVREDIFDGLKNEIRIENQSLTPKMKSLLTADIISEVDAVIKKDVGHMKYVQSLWNKAKGDYSSEIKSKIISAYLERAKSLVPSIRRRLLSEALGSSVVETERKREISDRTQNRREPGSQGKPSGNTVKNHSAKSVDWNSTTDMDFLSDNVTLKQGRK